MADNKKREERRRKRRKSAAAGRPASYSQLYKDDHSIGEGGSSDSAIDGSAQTNGGSAGSGGGNRPSRKGSDSVDWRGEYRHVLGDLRNVLIVSVLIFVLMIGVGLFL